MRQTGWYRVKYQGVWQFAEYYEDEWYITGNESAISESDLEINEELQNPEPPKKTGLDGDGRAIEVK